MTTKQIELRTEIVRKRIVLDRIAQPNERRMASAFVVIGCLGASAAIVIGYVFAGLFR